MPRYNHYYSDGRSTRKLSEWKRYARTQGLIIEKVNRRESAYNILSGANFNIIATIRAAAPVSKQRISL